MEGFIKQPKKTHLDYAAFKECILYPVIMWKDLFLRKWKYLNTALLHLQIITDELVAFPLLQNNPRLKVKGR